jgi:serine/threonine protein kinase
MADQELPEWAFLEGDAARAFVVDADDRSTVLGAGAYGAVYAATMQRLPVAAKTLHMLRDPVVYGLVGPGAEPGAAERVRAEFDAEAEALAAVRHPNVLAFLGVCYSRGGGGGGGGGGAAAGGLLPKWIITERQPYSLHAFLRLPGMHAAMGLADVTCVVADVAEGLGHLHSLGMVHRDLKPKNGESKRLGVESPWLQFTSACQHF